MRSPRLSGGAGDLRTRPVSGTWDAEPGARPSSVYSTHSAASSYSGHGPPPAPAPAMRRIPHSPSLGYVAGHSDAYAPFASPLAGDVAPAVDRYGRRVYVPREAGAVPLSASPPTHARALAASPGRYEVDVRRSWSQEGDPVAPSPPVNPRANAAAPSPPNARSLNMRYAGSSAGSAQSHGSLSDASPSTSIPFVRAAVPPAPAALPGDRVLIQATLDNEHFSVINVSGLESAPAIKDRIFRKLQLSPSEFARAALYRTEIGRTDITNAPAVDDDALLALCLQLGDDRGTVKFYVSTPVTGRPRSSDGVVSTPWSDAAWRPRDLPRGLTRATPPVAEPPRARPTTYQGAYYGSPPMRSAPAARWNAPPPPPPPPPPLANGAGVPVQTQDDPYVMAVYPASSNRQVTQFQRMSTGARLLQPGMTVQELLSMGAEPDGSASAPPAAAPLPAGTAPTPVSAPLPSGFSAPSPPAAPAPAPAPAPVPPASLQPSTSSPRPGGQAWQAAVAPAAAPRSRGSSPVPSTQGAWPGQTSPRPAVSGQSSPRPAWPTQASPRPAAWAQLAPPAGSANGSGTPLSAPGDHTAYPLFKSNSETVAEVRRSDASPGDGVSPGALSSHTGSSERGSARPLPVPPSPASTSSRQHSLQGEPANEPASHGSREGASPKTPPPGERETLDGSSSMQRLLSQVKLSQEQGDAFGTFGDEDLGATFAQPLDTTTLRDGGTLRARDARDGGTLTPSGSRRPVLTLAIGAEGAPHSPKHPASGAESSPSAGTFRGGHWAFRPPAEQLYEHLDDFFPRHDLDRPVDAGEESGATPAAAAPAPRLSRGTHHSIRVIAQNRKRFLERAEQAERRRAEQEPRRGSVAAAAAPGAARGALDRRRSTKLWGGRLVEMRGDQAESVGDVPGDANGGARPVFKWVKGGLIGKGTYGRVYLALNATTGEMIAVKQVELPRTESDRDSSRQRNVVGALMSEIETLKNLDHPNVVSYLGFEQTPEYLSIFLEYVPGGSIGSCLRRHGKFEEDTVSSFLNQTLQGLAYLHKQGILHRDLKADNLLVDYHGTCKISDFGTVRRSESIYSNVEDMSLQGSIFWMAPEVVSLSRKGYSAKVDIWSLGCVVLEMLAGRRPWSDEEAVHAMFKIGAERCAPPVPVDCKLSKPASHFLRNCFEIDPDRRPTASRLLEHVFAWPPPDWRFEDSALGRAIAQR